MIFDFYDMFNNFISDGSILMWSKIKIYYTIASVECLRKTRSGKRIFLAVY